METKDLKEYNRIKKAESRSRIGQKLYPESTKKSKEKLKATRLLIDFYNAETKALYEQLKPENLTRQQFQLILLKAYDKTLK